jgi:hypothetical protein
METARLEWKFPNVWKIFHFHFQTVWKWKWKMVWNGTRNPDLEMEMEKFGTESIPNLHTTKIVACTGRSRRIDNRGDTRQTKQSLIDQNIEQKQKNPIGTTRMFAKYDDEA